MLQQTQVKTVLPYFNRFLQKFPNLKSLSKTDEKTILKLWEGLGYYRRAKNLLSTVKILANNNFKLPDTFKEIKSLPGVGDYTANALLAFIYNKETIAVDGNVKRVFSRILNKKDTEINFENFVKNNKNNLFFNNRNSDFVEALMEFGSIVCKPQQPLCYSCVINKKCKYFQSKKKRKKTKSQTKKLRKINILCYLNKKKQIGLTKKNKVGFLETFVLPKIKKRDKKLDKNWNLLLNYNQSISNKTFNINLYYKFSKKIPKNFEWYKLNDKKEFIPSFTKKILSKVKVLYQ